MTEPAYCFSQRVDNYIKYRPRYPAAVLDLLKAECQLANTHVIADIGSGTGLLSELFLKNGDPVFGVEPDPRMRTGGEYYLRDYTGFTSVPATAEASTLPDYAVDFVTIGQALEPDDPSYGMMLSALEEIFWTYQENGRVTIEHDTRVVFGQLPLDG